MNGETGPHPAAGSRAKFTADAPSEADFEKQSVEERRRFLQQTQMDVFAIVDDFLMYANLCAEKFENSSLRHEQWRKWSIVATGVLAAINGVAAFDLIARVKLFGAPPQEIHLGQLLVAVAAVYAVVLTIFSNLENFFNAGEKAAGFRQSRDLFLSAYREYSQKWLEYVEAFGFTSRACVNAARLYRALVDADAELRAKVKELTQVQPRGGGNGAVAGAGAGS